MSASSHTRVSLLVTRLTTILALFVALVPICVYATSIYFSIGYSLTANLRVQAVLMEKTIALRPDHWDLTPALLRANYVRYVEPGEHFSIVNKKGKVVVELGPPLGWYMVTRSLPLHDFGSEVGQIRAGHPIAKHIFLGLLIFVVSLVVALLIRGPLRRIPLDALAQAETSLLQREQYQRALLDNFPFMVWLKDHNQRYLAANTKLSEQLHLPSAQALVGKEANELVPTTLAQVLALNPSEILQTGQATNVEEQVQLAGQQCWYEIYQAPVFLPSGEVLGTVGYARDISEKKLADQELLQHRHHLEELVQTRTIELTEALVAAESVSRLKTEFVSTVSHELRTPLTVISGSLGLICGGALGNLPPKMGSVLEMAHKNSLHLAHLINDLLDIEKLVAGKLHFDMATHTLGHLIDQTVAACQELLQQQPNPLILENPHPELEVYVDAVRLHQVLINFISNAVKFSPPAAPINVVVRVIDKSVRIEVVDRGPGISKEFRNRIFQRFAQADSSDTRQKGGTGLGLAISKELITQMHGQIGFTSEPGQGSCFFIELPLLATA